MSHGSLLVNFFPTKTRKRLQQHRRFSQLLPLFHPLVLPLFFHTPFPFVAAISATVLTDLALSSPDFCKSPDNLSPRAVRLRAKPRLRFFFFCWEVDGEMDGEIVVLKFSAERSLLRMLALVWTIIKQLLISDICENRNLYSDWMKIRSKNKSRFSEFSETLFFFLSSWKYLCSKWRI